ncbi:MAG TPA: hypothetical protein PK995_10325 [Bacteroidia bacterium]|nr:hypothetical protein [Bacteroidia bacterium]
MKKFILTLFSLIIITNYFSQKTFDTTYNDKGIKYILKYSLEDGNIDTISFEKRYKGKCMELVEKEGYLYRYYRRDPYLRVIRDKSTKIEISYSEKRIEIKRKIYDTILKREVEQVIMILNKKKRGTFFCKINKNYKLKFKYMGSYDSSFPYNFEDAVPKFEIVENEKILYQEGYVKIKIDKNKEIKNIYRIGRWLSLEEVDGDVKIYLIEYDKKKPESEVFFVEENCVGKNNELITTGIIEFIDIKPYKKKYIIDNIMKFR